MRKINNNKGFSLIEMVVYVSILSVVFILVINTLLIVSKSYRSIKLASDVNNSASASLERLTREIRLANSVATSSSVFGTNPGRLFLNTTDENGAPLTLDFYISNGSLNLNKNGTLSGVLTRDNIQVTNLIFRNIIFATSSTIKIEMEFMGTEAGKTKTEKFYGTSVLRGSY